jgi:hypothetical protein
VTPRFNLAGESTYNGCQKPGCTATRVYRHHRGGERTFLRQLRHLYFAPTHKQRYLEFHKRYHSYLPEDIVKICGDHHEEIHHLINEKDCDWMVEHNCIKVFGAFTWEQAMQLVEARRGWTDAWLKERTPGLRTRKFTGKP